MARGVTPRQPAKTGRQEGIKPSPIRVRCASVKPRLRIGTTHPTWRVPTNPASADQALQSRFPERVGEILKRLDQQYPTSLAPYTQGCVGTGGGDYSFRAIYRRECQSRYPGVVSKVPNRPGFCRAEARATGSRRALDRILPQQIEVGGRCREKGRRRLRRQSSR